MSAVMWEVVECLSNCSQLQSSAPIASNPLAMRAGDRQYRVKRGGEGHSVE